MSEKVTKWVSKYALTQGLTEIEGEITDGGYFFCQPFSACFGMCIHQSNYHDTVEEAAAKARQMRDKKIASLRAQIKKLEGMFV